MLLFRINDILYLPNISSIVLYDSPTIIIFTGYDIWNYNVWADFYHRLCKICNLFSYFIASFIQRKVASAKVVSASAPKVGLRCSYMSIIFEVVKGLTLTKNFWLISNCKYHFFALWSSYSFFLLLFQVCISEI